MRGGNSAGADSGHSGAMGMDGAVRRRAGARISSHHRARCPASPALGSRSATTPISICSCEHLDEVLDAAGVSSARHLRRLVWRAHRLAVRSHARPNRVRGLILVSTPGPRWRLNPHPGALCEVADAERARCSRSAPFGAFWREDVACCIPHPRSRLSVLRADRRGASSGRPRCPRRMSRRARLCRAAGFRSRLRLRHRSRRSS